MLGFAIIDRQPSATETAVWLTSRVANAAANHTNAVVITHDDPDYIKKVRSLTADRVVVLTANTEASLEFTHPVGLDVFDTLIAEALAHQARIDEAVEFARTHKLDPELEIVKIRKRNLTDPTYPRSAPVLAAPDPDDAAHRALVAANYVARCWEYWLKTDEQRVFRTVNAKTGQPPGLMPPGLDDRTLTEFPPGFADVVRPEPLVRLEAVP